MNKPILLITIFFTIICNCVYYRVSHVDCLYVSDLSKEDPTWQEFTFNLNEKVDSSKISDSSKLLKFVIDYDKNGYKYYAKKELPERYFKIKPKDRRDLDKEYSVYPISWFNASGWGTIDKIEFIANKLPFEIKSIDYGSYGWGGRQILISNIHDTGIVHVKIISSKDTMYTTMVISKDSLIIQPKCNVKSKTKKSLLLNPFKWLFIWLKIPF